MRIFQDHSQGCASAQEKYVLFYAKIFRRLYLCLQNVVTTLMCLQCYSSFISLSKFHKISDHCTECMWHRPFLVYKIMYIASEETRAVTVGQSWLNQGFFLASSMRDSAKYYIFTSLLRSSLLISRMVDKYLFFQNVFFCNQWQYSLMYYVDEQFVHIWDVSTRRMQKGQLAINLVTFK